MKIGQSNVIFCGFLTLRPKATIMVMLTAPGFSLILLHCGKYSSCLFLRGVIVVSKVLIQNKISFYDYLGGIQL